MSVHVSSWAWKQPVPDVGTKIVLVKLADNANDDGICWPSQRTLAEECGMGLRTVNRKIAWLLENGLLTAKDRGHRSSVYTLLIRQPGVMPESNTPTVAVLKEPSLNLEPSEPNGSVTAQSLVGEFVDSAKKNDLPLDRRIIGHLAKETDRLLVQGHTADQVRAAYGRMAERGVIQPSLLGNFMLEAALPRREPMRYGRGMTTAQILDWGKDLE